MRRFPRISGLYVLGILALFGLITEIRAKGNYSYEYEAQKSRSSTLGSAKSASASHADPVYFPGDPSAHDDHGPAKRSGIGIDKGPPDLQFGLAFTVPFVSLKTDQLLNQVSGKHGHRGYNSLSDMFSVLKLNVGGLILAAVVGLAALLFVPAIFKGNVPSFFHGGGGGNGNGWGPGSSFGNFMPAFLENFMPGLGFSKPIGYGQSYGGPNYDNTAYPYGNDNYGAYSQRKEQGKARSLDGKNGTGPSFWSDVLKTVKSTVVQAENCAAFAMCERGRDSVKNLTRSTGSDKGRGGRKLEDNVNHANTLSSFDHVLEAIHGVTVGGDDVPGFATLQKAYTTGASGLDCAKHYKKCPVTPNQLDGIMKDIGNYIFT